MDKWLARYIHNDPHEYFFYEFLIILYEWLTQFTYHKTNFQRGEPMSLTPELIQKLQEIDNKAPQDVQVWLESNLEVYIIDFVVDTTKSYNEAEREFFNELIGRFLLSLKLSIKILASEEGILDMQLEQQKSVVEGLWIPRKRGEGNGIIQGIWVQFMIKL